MKAYELTVLLHPDLEIDVDTPISKIEKLVEAAGGKVVKRDNWGKKRLAYRIKKQDFAVYVYFELNLAPNQVRKLDNDIRLSEEVLRHLLVNRLMPQTKAETKKAKEAKAPAAAAAAEEK